MFPVFPIWIAIALNRGAFKSLPKIYDGAFCENSKSSCLLFFHILTKERCSLFHLNGTSRIIHFFVIFSLLFIIILSRKADWVPHEKIKSTLLRFFDNSLSKYLIFKSFWYELVVLGYFTKIKKWSGTRFYCTCFASFF